MADYLGNLQHLHLLNMQNRNRRVYNVRADPFKFYSDSKFRKRYRFTKPRVRWLAKQIEAKIGNGGEKRGRALTPEQQVLIALRFYGTGCFHRESGDLLHVSEATACRVIKRVSLAIAGLKDRFISFPTAAEIPEVKAEFAKISGGNFPGIIGAVDCTHVKIQLPSKDDMGRFYCRKQYYSLNVQAIGDARLRIRNIVCRWPGATHDSRIFQNSAIKGRLANGEFKGHLLGDGGYSSTRFMLVPFRAPENAAQRRYNTAQIRARNSVERLFGVLKARFPVLGSNGSKLRLKLPTAQAVIVACAVLHNIALFHSEEPFPAVTYAARVRAGHVPLPDDVAGNAYRNSIVRNHFSGP